MTRHLGLTFTDELAQAVADGRKTQTRRPMKPQPPAEFRGPTAFPLAHLTEPLWAFGLPGPNIGTPGPCWPPGDEPGIKPRLPGSGIARVGDLLWVRECWAPLSDYTGSDPGADALFRRCFYRAEYPPGSLDDYLNRWRPSIHMPKWACRTWARITAVYPERVADISDEDAIAEGLAEPCGSRWLIPGTATEERSPRDCFLTAWRRIYDSTDGWCWVVKFERCDAPDLTENT